MIGAGRIEQRELIYYTYENRQLLVLVHRTAPRAGFSSRCYKRGRIRKKLFRRRAQSTPSSACACLHGLFHGQPGTQPSSTMPPASPAIACARRAPNPLHLLLTVIGRHGVHCFLQPRRAPWPCPHHSNMLGARSTLWSVHPACQLLLGKPVACWVHAKSMRVGGSVSRQGQILDFE